MRDEEIATRSAARTGEKGAGWKLQRPRRALRPFSALLEIILEQGVELDAKRGGSSALGSKVPSSALLLACFASVPQVVGRRCRKIASQASCLTVSKPWEVLRMIIPSEVVFLSTLSLSLLLCPLGIHLVPRLFLHIRPQRGSFSTFPSCFFQCSSQSLLSLSQSQSR